MKWNIFRAHIKEGFTLLELRAIKRAYLEMEEAHRDEIRDDGKPYILHPIESVLEAYAFGERDVEVMVAILMHDVLESAQDFGKTLTALDLEMRHGIPAACRVQWMTKTEHTKEHRLVHWQNFRKCKDRKVYKAKCYERLNNVSSFSHMKAKKNESKEQRIKRKVNETIREFVPLVTWLLADVEVRSFPNELARDKERHLIKNIRSAFSAGLARYNARFA